MPHVFLRLIPEKLSAGEGGKFASEGSVQIILAEVRGVRPPRQRARTIQALLAGTALVNAGVTGLVVVGGLRHGRKGVCAQALQIILAAKSAASVLISTIWGLQ